MSVPSRNCIHALRRVAQVAALMVVASVAGAAMPSTVVDRTPEQGKLPALLQQEVAIALKENKVPFVQLTAEWCGPCKALRASMNDPKMKDAFAGTYIIRLDMDAWKPQLISAGLDIQYVPVFFAMDQTGRPTGAKIHGGAWKEDIPRNMAPPLSKFFRANGAKR